MCDPIVIWRSKKPRCFKRVKDISRPHGVHYFANTKAWMTTEIMQKILTLLEKKMVAEDRKVLLTLDNAPCHPENLQENLRNIKLLPFPKNTTSRLQPCDAGIIRSFKHKYRKILVRFVLARIDSGKTASEIIRHVTILKVISWIKSAWAEVTSDTIKNCFKKCGFGEPEVISEETLDEELNELLKELSPGVSAEEFVEFDDGVDICEPVVNTQSVGWREQMRFESIQSVISPERSNESESEEDTNLEEDALEVESTPVSSAEALTMLDQLQEFFEANDEEDDSSAVRQLTRKVEQMRLATKKQKTIHDYFM